MENIDLYYQSLKQVLDDLEAWEPPKPGLVRRFLNWWVGFSIVLFVLCLIPIIPTVLILLRANFPIQIGGLDTTSGSFSAFGLLWLISAVASGLLMIPPIWIDNKYDKRFEPRKKPRQTLSDDQIAFVKTYEAYKELKVYFVSHVDRHVENAYKAISSQLGVRTFPLRISDEFFLDDPYGPSLVQIAEDASDELRFSPEIRPYSSRFYRSHSGSLREQLSASMALLGTFNKYDWFNLDPKTNSVLRALVSLPSKIVYRLRDQEELPRVLEVLEHMSKFLYAYLPEHAADKEEEEIIHLREQGRMALDSFVASVNELTEYRGKQVDKPKTLNGKPKIRNIANQLYNRFIFARFVVWFILVLILTSVGVVVFNQFVPISSDAMATIVIGGSVASATGLAVFLPRPQEGNH